jgi:hypothetical protein
MAMNTKSCLKRSSPSISRWGRPRKHLVEEVTGVIWRKRRLRLGERAAHHRALKRAGDPYHDTAKAALIHVPGHVEIGSVDDAIRATDEQTAEHRADADSGQAMTENALGLLETPSPTAYSLALGALRDDTGAWWEEQRPLIRTLAMLLKLGVRIWAPRRHGDGGRNGLIRYCRECPHTCAAATRLF